MQVSNVIITEDTLAAEESGQGLQYLKLLFEAGRHDATPPYELIRRRPLNAQHR